MALLLHGEVSGADWLSAWHVDPALAGLFTLVATSYGWAAVEAARRGHGLPGWQVAAFFSGMGALAVALLGPPSHYAAVAFSAHMVQHLLLIQLAAPLLVLGRPLPLLLRVLPPTLARRVVQTTVGRAPVRRLLRVAFHPMTATFAFNGSLIVWHLAPLYEAAVRSPWVHEIEHLAFFGTALLFWAALIDPPPGTPRPTPTAALLALFTTWMVSDLLGATLTLAREPLYPLYADASHPWGLTVGDDQRIGGLVMWVGGGVYYAAIMVGVLAAAARPRLSSWRPGERSARHSH
jgi:cytochrome c oxidase assembly factor CtaG